MCRGFGRETKGQGALGRPRRRWEDNLIRVFKKENPAQPSKNGRAVFTTAIIIQIS